MDATQATREDLLELIRDLRGWAETYEDWMGPEDFARREQTVAKAESLLLQETGRI